MPGQNLKYWKVPKNVKNVRKKIEKQKLFDS